MPIPEPFHNEPTIAKLPLEQAFANWLESFVHDPQAPEAMFFLGYAREKQGRAADARQTYRQLIDGFPDSPSAAAARRRLGE